VTWRTREFNVCPFCTALAGYTWTFDMDADKQLPPKLNHPVIGNVCDVLLHHSEVHQHHNIAAPCYCHLETDFDISDWLPILEEMATKLEANKPK